ncbi:MAG: sulfurtransferase [Solirubrobacterales bacterium]|nr:sulfurtransferase [Solirubrobacterales bacterium]MBV9716493.1 sulfurtransferase [Solirubrobacterales bacterium]
MTLSTRLVETAWVDEHLEDPELLICDCRFAGTREASEAVYLAGHIPGAIHVYWLDALCTADTTVTTFLPTAAEAQRKLGALGITEGTYVVGYAEAGSPYASRLWHVLSHFGHERVALLDGGIDKWLAEGRPVRRERVPAAAAAFHPSTMNGTITAGELRRRFDDPKLRILDVRSPAEYDGSDRRAARGGHIPGALLLPWQDDLRQDGTLRSPAELRARAEALGIAPEHEVVTYCQGGVRAAHSAFALSRAGYPNVRVYDGSWAEWGNEPHLPVETAPELAAT